MWIIFKVFCIEFATTLSLFYVSFFWPWGMWDLSFLIRDWICTPCMGRWSLHHWTTREVPSLLSLWEHNHTIYLHTVLLYTAPFILHWQNCVLLTQTAWAAKSKVSAVWPLRKKSVTPGYKASVVLGHGHQPHVSHCVLHPCQSPNAPRLLEQFLPQIHLRSPSCESYNKWAVSAMSATSHGPSHHPGSEGSRSNSPWPAFSDQLWHQMLEVLQE